MEKWKMIAHSAQSKCTFVLKFKVHSGSSFFFSVSSSNTTFLIEANDS